NHHTNGLQANDALTINLDQSDEAAHNEIVTACSCHVLVRATRNALDLTGRGKVCDSPPLTALSHDLSQT
uniref:hypothetical protein n=1 Tax=Ruegeria atlantica TaxID=81569 RepID=UPI002494DB7E